jgi:serine/threonine protein kinase/tetratricopeptide (TPR) repeat protein
MSVTQQLERGLNGRYSLERQLGEGGMALVFLARDLRHDRPVALKVLKPEISAEIGAERFLREIKLAARLTHPHILPVYDSGEADGLLFYVMPNMEGKSLRERLDRERQLSLPDALRFAEAVASALDYAHRQHILHRDVKPENILFNEGNVMLADFGIGKALSGGKSITQTGMFVGTPTYISPEQAAGEVNLDGRSDIYSLGCVLYEMLAGEPPFTGASPQIVISKRFTSPIPKVRAVRDVPEAVDDIVSRALARTPADRFSSAADFGAALKMSRDGTKGATTPPDAQKSPSRPKAIAVLPLANMSADPENEYFSDGMTEEIINVLAKVPGLHVASRSSCFAFKGKTVDIREVGDKLGVSTVVEGSVRKIGNRIRITAELISVENGYHLWSETYDRQLEDVFAIQDEIARAIVDALKVRLSGENEQLVVPAKNLEAYNLNLKARYLYHRGGEASLKKSLDFSQQVLLLEPGYARAYATMADCWCRLADDFVAPDDAYPRAKAAATRALQLEPDLPEALTSLGKILGWYEWDFAGAEQTLRRAVALSPNDGDAHYGLASVLPTVGKLGEAITVMRKALLLDPLDPTYSRWIARFLFYAGDYSAAIAQGEKIVELGEEYFLPYLDIGSAHLAQGHAELALEWYRKGQMMASSVRSYDAFIVRALAELDRRDEAEEILVRLERESKEHYVRPEYMAMGYGWLGELDRAFAFLERAFQMRSAGLIFLHVDPGYKPLRGDPRFDQLVNRIGLK